MAPSPTGFFHVGSARTALYNWLFARHHKGTFILRVEDTDVERSSQDMIKVILDGLSWLGLDWDEGPYFQSQRLALYQGFAEKLLDSNKAYYCYCSPEDLEKEKQAAYKQKKDWQYDRRCLNLSSAEREAKEKAHTPKALRFLVPDHTVSYSDLVHGTIEREGHNIEDFVILRANLMPTYNLACVADDHDMGISHVIRAVDHITNTPKQILLYEALGLPKPEFGHLPLILGVDKKKLSKRHGAVSLTTYRELGFLPEAVFNFLALLGWSPGDDREIMTITEMIDHFTLERINAANAVFDVTKLEWMNGQYIYALTDEQLLEKVRPCLIAAGLITDEQIAQRRDWVLRICHLMKPRLKVLNDIIDGAGFFFTEDVTYDEKGLRRHLNENTISLVRGFIQTLEIIEPFHAAEIEQALRTFVITKSIKARALIHPLRVFVTGKDGGPGLFETFEVIGREACINRLKKIVKKYEVRHE
jgi:glutamyl-tRNA synthetase